MCADIKNYISITYRKNSWIYTLYILFQFNAVNLLENNLKILIFQWSIRTLIIHVNVIDTDGNIILNKFKNVW